MRFSLYKFIHTAIRGQICDLNLQAGRVVYTNRNEVKNLCTRAKIVADFIKNHGKHEDDVIHPVLKNHQFPELSRLENEHHSTNAKIDSLVNQIAVLENMNDRAGEKKQVEDEAKAHGYEFVKSLSVFTSEYFSHMLTEENEVMKFLWSKFDDDYLFKNIHMEIQKTVPIPEIKHNIPLVYPYIDLDEACMVTKGLATAFPNEIGVMSQLIKDSVSEEDCKKIFTFAGITGIHYGATPAKANSFL